jgi:multisubunit Na+/H+ antiporter MnhB subunit
MSPDATILFKTMHRITQAVSLCLGSVGILALWVSFYRPDLAIYAILMLGGATVMTLGTQRGHAERIPRKRQLP